MRDEAAPSSPMHGLAARVRPGVLLGLMLLLLHAGLVLGLDSGAARALLLAHFGLFLLWQPVWQGSSSLQPRRVLLVVGGGLLFVWWIDWWLAGLWMALLFSLIGANLLTLRARRQRLAPLLAALYLLAALLVWVVPRLLDDADPPALLGTTLRDVLAAPLLVILLLPGAPVRQEPRSALDLFYSFLLFLMTIVLVLGTLFVQQVTHNPYALALAETVLAIAAVLFLLSWLWDPRGGFDGCRATSSASACPSNAGCTVWPTWPRPSTTPMPSSRPRRRRCGPCPGWRACSGAPAPVPVRKAASLGT